MDDWLWYIFHSRAGLLNAGRFIRLPTSTHTCTGNDVGNDGAAALAECLEINSVLTSLDLRCMLCMGVPSGLWLR